MERTIYIENLYPDVDVYLLTREFAKFGNILSASIDYDENYISLCKGQIIFQKASSAKTALNVDGLNIFGKPLTVKIKNFEDKKSQMTEMSHVDINKSYKKVFVKNINPDWDDIDLINEFKNFGTLVEATVSKCDGKSNGYGFVKFQQHACAKAAVEKMNDKVVCNRVLKVEPYLPKEIREKLNANSLDYAKEMLEKSVQLNNLHIKNLPKNFSEMKLRQLFEDFGDILSVKIARNENKESKGFGFVAFKSEKDAEKAHFRMNGYSLNSNILEVNFNQKREQRQHYLQLLKSEPEVANKNKKSQNNYSPVKQVTAGIVPSQTQKTLFSFSAKRH